MQSLLVAASMMIGASALAADMPKVGDTAPVFTGKLIDGSDAPECQGVPTVRRRPAILGQLPDGANLSQLDEASRNGVEGALAEARTNASTPSSAAPSTKAKSYAMLLSVAE